MPDMMHGWKPRRVPAMMGFGSSYLEYTHPHWKNPVRQVDGGYVTWDAKRNNLGMAWKTFREAREEIQAIVNERSRRETSAL